MIKCTKKKENSIQFEMLMIIFSIPFTKCFISWFLDSCVLSIHHAQLYIMIKNTNYFKIILQKSIQKYKPHYSVDWSVENSSWKIVNYQNQKFEDLFLCLKHWKRESFFYKCKMLQQKWFKMTTSNNWN